jgi:hypothetical protein
MGPIDHRTRSEGLKQRNGKNQEQAGLKSIATSYFLSLDAYINSPIQQQKKEIEHPSRTTIHRRREKEREIPIRLKVQFEV